MMTISEIIKTYRKSNHLTQEEFACKLTDGLPGASLTKQAVNTWEKGRFNPRIGLLLAIKLTYDDWRSEMAAKVIEILEADPMQRSVVKKGADGILKHL